MNIIYLIFAGIWISVGFISFRLMENAWREKFYINTGLHFTETVWYNKVKEAMFDFAFSFMGFISLFIVVFFGNGIIFNSSWMIVYRKSVVEKRWGSRKEKINYQAADKILRKELP